MRMDNIFFQKIHRLGGVLRGDHDEIRGVEIDAHAAFGALDEFF